MSLSAREKAFLEENHSAAMVTIAADGTPKVARVGTALVGEHIWSSGTVGRVRTKRLRRDPRCTLFVFPASFEWLALETTVTILEGPQAAHQNLLLFRVMQGRPSGPLLWFGGELEEETFLRTMVDEGRLI